MSVTERELLELLAQKVNGIENNVTELNTKVAQIDGSLTELGDKVVQMDNSLKELDEKVNNMEKDIQDIKYRQKAIYEQTAFLAEYKTENDNKISELNKRA